jgi:hypothetical protein
MTRHNISSATLRRMGTTNSRIRYNIYVGYNVKKALR